ncbi:MAG TPA: hypothetical protein DCP67_06175, partial [Planctomycetaceae bacterium]|nr:hypothetical protein [Planctomycetaceae bacterium]HCK72621.1 hypothetical protein [Planctomycetaceae bacterium]
QVFWLYRQPRAVEFEDYPIGIIFRDSVKSEAVTIETNSTTHVASTECNDPDQGFYSELLLVMCQRELDLCG